MYPAKEWRPPNDWRPPMGDVVPITKASFVLAFAEARPCSICMHVLEEWQRLHIRDVFDGEIDEDPS